MAQEEPARPGEEMNLADATRRAEELRRDLSPFCIAGSVVVVGSVRRKKTDPGDIELVAIPDLTDYDKVDGIIKLLTSGKYGSVKTGMFPARQTTLHDGLCSIEIYWQSKQSYGLNLWIRTGPSDYVARGLAFWKRITNGGYSEGAILHLADGAQVPTLTEQAVYDAFTTYAGKPVKWVPPEKRQ